ncbi:aldehyde dehydrogenase (NADP(+)) [Microbacterium candidum]|uniref:Aldehyde dehydrogenase (NADP(+)) n=1 Tax=Microbacterium candidum TaxID=3041922 RepID=A0ABT7MTL2_9MICO|nr:aldehyde dehydrogenase (NADP(+)) [Microbacterium sp. ASV49]MDL9977790.1 aldehyde dehydrogenase (NADP(+)) [Microbacterium sp. ASV49]
MLYSTDPRSGRRTAVDIEPTSDDEVAATLERATAAAHVLRSEPRAWRSHLLRSLADALTRRGEELVSAALAETGLTRSRLEGEVARAAGQFRLFADVVDEGSYLEAAIDHAVESPSGRAPEIRRMLVPLGPVAVFGSSNFPFAFSVAGGDTASALAAGNPVILKAHSSHIEVSRLSFEILDAAARSAGAPPGTLEIVYGQEAGRALVAHPAVRAVGFTGSQSTAEALLEVIRGRAEPIPFYGELSSLNPLIVSAQAAVARSTQIAEGLIQSVLGSSGQLCTKPGLLFVPGAATELVDALVAAVSREGSHVLLNDRIATSYREISGRLVDAGAETAARGSGPETEFSVNPALLVIPAHDFTSEVAEEVFGPLAVIVRYRDVSEIPPALDAVPGSLTATIHSEPQEQDFRAAVVDAIEDRVGRIVFNGYPTGVRVSWAQHHGGPWPATNTQHTSVGATAIRRFLRPLAWQDAPEDVLPTELRNDSDVPRRIDGALILAGASTAQGR